MIFYFLIVVRRRRRRPVPCRLRVLPLPLVRLHVELRLLDHEPAQFAAHLLQVRVEGGVQIEKGESLVALPDQARTGLAADRKALFSKGLFQVAEAAVSRNSADEDAERGRLGLGRRRRRPSVVPFLCWSRRLGVRIVVSLFGLKEDSRVVLFSADFRIFIITHQSREWATSANSIILIMVPARAAI
jgi:hypothetical protein